jgi:hypothetical protein
LFGEFHLDCRKAFDPRTQVAREHKGAATGLTARSSPDLIAS